MNAVYGTAGVEYDVVQGGSGQRTNGSLGIVLDTTIGRIDASGFVEANRFAGKDDTGGFDIGYTNGLKLTAGTLSARVGYGRRNHLNDGDNVQFYSLGAEFAAPITNKLGVFVGYRHRNTIDTAGDFAENRFTGGIDYAVTPKISVRAGYAHTEVSGVNLRGALATVSYKF